MSRITRNTPPPPARSTPPAQNDTHRTTTPATNTPANQTTATNRAHELTQAAQFVRAGLERILTTAANARNNQQRVQDAASQVRQSYYGGDVHRETTYPINAARELARQLSQNNDPQFQQQLMAELAKDPQVFDDILRAAGGDPRQLFEETNVCTRPIDDSERSVIARALSSAYEAGLITQEDLLRATNAPRSFQSPAAAGYLGLLIAQSGSENFIRDYATAVLTYVRDNSPDTFNFTEMVSSAARAMAGSPRVLEEMIGRLQRGDFLSQDPTKISLDLPNFIALITPLGGRAEDYYPASGTRATPLGDILTTATEGNLPLQTRADLLAATVNYGRLSELGDNEGTRSVLDALINLYCEDAQALTHHFIMQASDSDTRITNFARFFQHTLFSSVVSETSRERLTEKVGEVASTYHSRNTGYFLGRLAGTVIGGYVYAVEKQQERDKATLALANTILSIAPMPRFLGDMLGGVASGLVKQIISNADSLVAKEARSQLAGMLAERLTQRGGFLGFGGLEVRSGSDLNQLLKATFGYDTLHDDDGNDNNENSQKKAYDDAIGQVLDILHLEKLKP